MTKAEVRKKALKQRMGLSKDEVKELSLELLARFTELDFSGVEVVHVFLPMDSKNEPDTFLFVDWLRLNKPNVTILVPRADFDASLMTNHVYTGLDGLSRSVFGILEPVGEMQYEGRIDLVLVPLLAFDRRGYRVGYGKGFYDRFLSGIETKKVGLSLFEPVEEIADADQYDVKMDACICPGGIYRFT